MKSRRPARRTTRSPHGTRPVNIWTLNDLERVARVAHDLLERGASEVVISPSSGIVVRRGQQRENQPLPQSSVQQRVIVTSQTSAQATAHSSVQFVAQIAVIERELSKSHPEQSEEIKRQLESLKEELTKKQPDSSKLKKTLRWALEFDVNTFLKLAKAVAEWLGVL